MKRRKVDIIIRPEDGVILDLKEIETVALKEAARQKLKAKVWVLQVAPKAK